MRSAGGNSGAWVFNIDANNDRTLYSRNGGNRRILASNTKLFTTAAMLDRFGADGKLETDIYARGERLGQNDQVLKGDLVVVGDGDPALSSAGFANRNNLPNTSLGELVAEVRAAGIKVVRDDVRVDDTIFDRQRRSGPYLSPLSGLSYNSGYSPGGGYASDPEFVAGRALKDEAAQERDQGPRRRQAGEPSRFACSRQTRWGSPPHRRSIPCWMRPTSPPTTSSPRCC